VNEMEKEKDVIEAEKYEVQYAQFANRGGFRLFDVLYKENSNVEDTTISGESLVNGIFGKFVLSPINPDFPAIVVLREQWSVSKGYWDSDDGVSIIPYVYRPDEGWKSL